MILFGKIPFNPAVVNIPTPPPSQPILDNDDNDILDNNDEPILDNG